MTPDAPHEGFTPAAEKPRLTAVTDPIPAAATEDELTVARTAAFDALRAQVDAAGWPHDQTMVCAYLGDPDDAGARTITFEAVQR